MGLFNLDHWYWRLLSIIIIPFIIVGGILFFAYVLTIVLPLIEWVILGEKNFTFNFVSNNK